MYGLVILATLWIAQFLVFGVVALLSSGANGNGLIALVPLGMGPRRTRDPPDLDLGAVPPLALISPALEA